MPTLSNDYVVMDHNAERLYGLDDSFGHFDISAGRGRITGWVVVYQNKGRGIQFQ